MPLYNEEQKNFIVTKMGYNPSEFDYDEISNTVIKRPAKLSPSTSEVVDDGKVELPEVQQELFSPLQTGVGTFAESALPAVTGGYVAGNVAKAVSPLMGKGIAGTLGGIGLIAASGLLSGRIAKAAQDAAANTIMPETMDTLQQSQIENSTSATLGGLASIPLGGMWPNLPNVGRAIGTIPKLAMGMAPKAEEVANLSNVAGGAAIGTGIDWLNAKSQNAEFNPVESLLINTVFNKPNILGRKYGFTDPADLPPSEPTREFLAKPQEDKIQGVEVFNPETRPYLSNEEFWNDLAKLRNASKNEPLNYSLESQKIEKPEFVSSITKRGYTKEEVKQGSKEFEDRMKELRSKIPFLNKETKYQDVPTEKPVYTRQQQELLDKVKVDDDPINTTEFWDNFWNELSARRNVKVTEDGTIVNAQTGKPVAGQASERVGNEPVDVRINPEIAGADTRPHELTHPSFTDLKKSPRRGDNIVYEKSVKIVKQSPEYADWKVKREAQKLDGSVEEFIATNGGIEAVSRALQNSSSNTTRQNIKNWWRDVSAYYKLRFTKHATIDEMQRVINYKMLHDPDFASVFKKSAITTQNVSKTIENSEDLNTPEFKLIGSQMWKGREIPESMVTPEMNDFTIENYGDFFKRHPLGSKVKASNPDGGGSFYGTVKGHTRNGNLQVELSDGSIRYSSEKQIFGEGLRDKSAATVAPKNAEETSADTSVKNKAEPFGDDWKSRASKNSDESLFENTPAEQDDFISLTAVKTPDGSIFTGSWHGEAAQKAVNAGKLKQVSDPKRQDGFVTEQGKFLTRDEASDIISANEGRNVNATYQSLYGGKEMRRIPKKNSDNSLFENTPQDESIANDVQLYNSLVESFKNEKDINKKMEYWKNIETIKNKYGGNISTKNQEQSLLPNFEDKKIRAASAFAKMREATDNPEIVKQAEKEDIANTIAETNTKIDKKAGIDRSSEMYSTESILKQTETPEFKKWFGDSKVVDEDGNPLPMFHGSYDPSFTEFKFNDNGQQLGPGSYFTQNPDLAKKFVGDKGAIYKTFLKIENPLIVRSKDHYNDLAQDFVIENTKDYKRLADKVWDEMLEDNIEYLTQTSNGKSKYELVNLKNVFNRFLQEQGYDGILEQKFQSGKPYITEAVIFKPENIKSATGNTGAFDPKNPDIRYSTESILKQTETPEFKRWFGDSKVVDEETGKPLVVYHGSNSDINVFDKNKTENGKFGKATYFVDDPKVAEKYGKAVYPTFIKLENPLKLTFDFTSKEKFLQQVEELDKKLQPFHKKTNQADLDLAFEEMWKDQKSGKYIYEEGKNNTSSRSIYHMLETRYGRNWPELLGHDGLIVDVNPDSALGANREYVVYNSENIKSAIGNTGAFDPTNKDIRYSTESILKQTETPEFKKWFEGSKVVDEETGKPLVVYHGTDKDFSEFNTTIPNASKFGPASYFSADTERAGRYANKANGSLYPAYLSLKNPYIAKHFNDVKYLPYPPVSEKWKPLKDKALKALKDKYGYDNPPDVLVGNEMLRLAGYDGVIEMKDGIAKEYAVFYPESIKSATGNTGAFDPKNPDIRYSTSSALFEFRKPEIEKIRTLKHKDADKVADAFTDFYRSYDRYKGKFAAIGTDKLIDKLSYTNPKERFFQDNQKYRDTVQYLDDMMDYGKSSIKPDPEVLQIIKDVNAETLKSKAASMDLGDLEGHEYYLAQVQSRKVMSMLLNEPDSPKTKALLKDWFTYYKDVLGKNRDEALEALRIFKAGFNKQNSDLASQYGPIDKAAGVGIPSSWREKNLIDRLGRFVNRYSRRLAHIDKIENNKIVQDALNDPEKGLAGADVVRNVMFDIEGQRDIAEANREVISGLVRSAWMGTLTGVKDFTSNLFLGMQHQTLDQAMLSPFKAWSNMKQNLKESFEAGVNRKNIGALEMLGDDATINEIFQYLRRGRDILNTVSGRNYLEKITRATAFGQGKWLAQDNIWRAHKNRLNSQSEKFLNDFVPDWKSYVKSGILPADVLERAATDYVGSVQGTYDPRGLPIIAQRGSLAPYLSLSRWSIEKLNNFEKHVVKPAMQGNYKPLLNQTIGLMIGGAAVNAIVEELTGKKEKTPKLKELKEIAASGNDPILPLTYKLAAYASLSGYAGMYGDVAKMIMDKTYKNRIQTMNNPVIEGTYMLGKNTADYLQALKDEGVTPENVGRFIEQNLEDYFQVYRLMAANTSEDKKKEIEKSNEFRDLKLYRNTHGEETSDVTTDRANPFKDQDIKKFREEEDITKILPEAEKLIAKAFENADGDIFKLRKELRKIKFNSNRTMPSIDESPDSFQKYLLYLEKTQGRDEAVRRMTKYFKDRALNKSKSDLVPDV